MNIEILKSTEDIYAGIKIWNNNNEKMKIRKELINQNIFAPFSGINVVAIGLKYKEEMVGFSVIKYLNSPINNYTDQSQGWISLLSVSRKEDGFEEKTRMLLQYSEKFLIDRGVKEIRFGGDPQNFLPGLPFSLREDYLHILKDFNYHSGSTEYDLYQDITDFNYMREVKEANHLSVRRVSKDNEGVLYNFLNSNFPGRWLYEAENIGQIPGGIDDYWLLWYQEQPVGFARCNTVDSTYKGPNVNWVNQRGELYCGLGPLGISSSYRKNGWGLYMITEIINNLRDEGYQHLVIDWTTLVDYYNKLGFEPSRKYITLTKNI